MRRAAFLDRDGVINELVPDVQTGLPESPLDPEDVQVIPGAPDALRRLRSAGFLLVTVSNQPAAAKGTVTLARLEAVHIRVIELLAEQGVEIDASRFCFHHPDGTTAGLSGECDCRKPAPGMLLEAAADLGIELAESWMIGDTDADVEAGEEAGCRTVLVENPKSAHKRTGRAPATFVAPTLEAATGLVIRLPIK